MASPLSDTALDQLFRTARTHRGWTDAPVSDITIQALSDLVKMAPTAHNGHPARFVFVKSAEAKARLVPLMSQGNQDKVATAPVTVIIGADHAFYEHFPRLSPGSTAGERFAANPDVIPDAVLRNSTIEGTFLIMAARALGLDTGPMSGFDVDAVDAEFFAGTRVRTNFICNIGYGDETRLRPRQPRFDFDEFCTLL